MRQLGWPEVCFDGIVLSLNLTKKRLKFFRRTGIRGGSLLDIGLKFKGRR